MTLSFNIGTMLGSVAPFVKKKCGRVFVAVSLLLVSLPTSSFRLEGSANSEYKLKAAFLYNFTQYFDWDIAGGDFVIGVLGSSPITDQLEQIAKIKTVKDKRIVIRQLESVGEIGACHILFVASSSSAPLSAVLEKAGRGTLTVCERNGYGARGAPINFIIVDNKLRFEANLKAINAAGLRASSQLLKLAIIVG
jgi:hypothetical protein